MYCYTWNLRSIDEENSLQAVSEEISAFALACRFFFISLSVGYSGYYEEISRGSHADFIPVTI
jgi:hypothetical protein